MSYKLSVKVGAAEFCAEGPEDAVKEQFAAFVQLVSAAPAAAKPPPPPLDPALKNGGVNGAGNGNGGVELGVDRKVLDDAFMVDARGIVSLRTLPTSDNRDADALILLMYGNRALRQTNEVSADALVNGARQSGLTIDRTDRALTPVSHLHRKGGVRRGSRYSLNNPGISHAEGLLREMYG